MSVSVQAASPRSSMAPRRGLMTCTVITPIGRIDKTRTVPSHILSQPFTDLGMSANSDGPTAAALRQGSSRREGLVVAIAPVRKSNIRCHPSAPDWTASNQ